VGGQIVNRNGVCHWWLVEYRAWSGLGRHLEIDNNPSTWTIVKIPTYQKGGI
jgi:hypothetical protein